MSTLTPLPPNVRDDGKRLIAVAKVGRDLREKKRFPHATPLRTITDWLETTRARLRQERRATQRLKQTLGGEVAAYVKTVPQGRARANTHAYLRAWVLALGDVSRKALTPERLQEVITGWIEAGIAASSLKHRRRALAQLLEARHDHTLAVAVRGLKLPREPKAEPRSVDLALLHALLSGMNARRSVRYPGRGGAVFGNKTRARLLMMLWTGITPASLRRLHPSAIHLEQGTITLPPRQKGTGAESVTLPLFGEAPAACQAWLRASAWGAFDQRALGKCFHTAVRTYVRAEAAAGRTVLLPPDLRPYDLRHSFLSWLWTVCHDPLVVQEYAQHADLKTTARYTRGAVSARLQAVAARLNQKIA
jgi:integrase